ncbi:MAG: antibiotic biosynthesis monooxygenase [Acidobacteria bacterium]|nr:antibiotic biosynthesis monooxygenase [Acidobacteriota bacterium]MCL5288307.1 antibiotic biosynthesis monooxygenase [Acidobacteriota bacterium]
MYARVMQIRILPGKLSEFLVAVESLRPGLLRQPGFRAMMILRSPETPAKEGCDREICATTYTVWESMEHMRASEKNMFLYQALARMKEHCKGFPQIHEEEVIASELGGAPSDDTQS